MLTKYVLANTKDSGTLSLKSLQTSLSIHIFSKTLRQLFEGVAQKDEYLSKSLPIFVYIINKTNTTFFYFVFG